MSAGNLLQEGLIVPASVDNTADFHGSAGYDIKHREIPDKMTMSPVFEYMCRTHAVCGNDDLYVSRMPDEVIDTRSYPIKRSIPEFDTSGYGWIVD